MMPIRRRQMLIGSSILAVGAGVAGLSLWGKRPTSAAHPRVVATLPHTSGISPEVRYAQLSPGFWIRFEKSQETFRASYLNATGTAFFNLAVPAENITPPIAAPAQISSNFIDPNAVHLVFLDRDSKVPEVFSVRLRGVDGRSVRRVDAVEHPVDHILLEFLPVAPHALTEHHFLVYAQSVKSPSERRRTYALELSWPGPGAPTVEKATEITDLHAPSQIVGTTPSGSTVLWIDDKLVNLQPGGGRRTIATPSVANATVTCLPSGQVVVWNKQGAYEVVVHLDEPSQPVAIRGILPEGSLLAPIEGPSGDLYFLTAHKGVVCVDSDTGAVQWMLNPATTANETLQRIDWGPQEHLYIESDRATYTLTGR